MPRDIQRELLELFGQEAEGRLRQLAEQLLELEEGGPTDDLVSSMFRDAHTLKGSSAVIGQAGFSRVAHAMEDLLDDVRHGVRAPDAELVDALLVAVDGLRRLLPGVLAEDDITADADALARQLTSSARGPARPGLPAVPPPEPAAATVDRRPPAGGAVVHVPLRRLDALAGLVGESAAANLRLSRLLQHELGPSVLDRPEVHDLARTLNRLQETTMRARMVPIATAVEPLRRAVREVARVQGKDVRWEVSGGETELDRSVLDRLSEALVHLVRNAVDHGVESPGIREAAGKARTATVRLHAVQIGSEVVVSVSDDGAGIDVSKLRQQPGGQELDDEDAFQLMFRAGVSTSDEVTDISGRGVGLDVVKTAIDAVRGRVEVGSELGLGTEFRLVVPITLAVLRCLFVESAGRLYALPIHSVETALSGGEELIRVDGQPAIRLESGPVAVSGLAETIGMGVTASEGPVIVLAGIGRRHAFRVDRLAGQRDVVVKNLSPLLPRVDALAGASVEPDGSILAVLDAAGLIDRARRAQARPATATPEERGADSVPAVGSRPSASDEHQAVVLVVDDALTVRTVQRAILERAGYRVNAAADGLEALTALRARPADLVLTDLEMPRMGGISLIRAIRAERHLAQTSIIVLTSSTSDDDRRDALEAGADAYVVKSEFDQASLLELVSRFLGGQP